LLLMVSRQQALHPAQARVESDLLQPVIKLRLPFWWVGEVESRVGKNLSAVRWACTFDRCKPIRVQ
jgi:hypothetical protein